MLQIRPISDLRNKFPDIVNAGKSVVLTKNGYGTLVMLWFIYQYNWKHLKLKAEKEIHMRFLENQGKYTETSINFIKLETKYTWIVYMKNN